MIYTGVQLHFNSSTYRRRQGVCSLWCEGSVFCLFIMCFLMRNAEWSSAFQSFLGNCLILIAHEFDNLLHRYVPSAAVNSVKILTCDALSSHQTDPTRFQRFGQSCGKSLNQGEYTYVFGQFHAKGNRGILTFQLKCGWNFMLQTRAHIRKRTLKKCMGSELQRATAIGI